MAHFSCSSGLVLDRDMAGQAFIKEAARVLDAFYGSLIFLRKKGKHAVI